MSSVFAGQQAAGARPTARRGSYARFGHQIQTLTQQLHGSDGRRLSLQYSDGALPSCTRAVFATAFRFASSHVADGIQAAPATTGSGPAQNLLRAPVSGAGDAVAATAGARVRTRASSRRRTVPAASQNRALSLLGNDVTSDCLCFSRQQRRLGREPPASAL